MCLTVPGDLSPVQLEGGGPVLCAGPQAGHQGTHPATGDGQEGKTQEKRHRTQEEIYEETITTDTNNSNNNDNPKECYHNQITNSK